MRTILCALVMLAPLPALAAHPAVVVAPSTPVVLTTVPAVSPPTVIVAGQPPAIPVYSVPGWSATTNCPPGVITVGPYPAYRGYYRGTGYSCYHYSHHHSHW